MWIFLKVVQKLLSLFSKDSCLCSVNPISFFFRDKRLAVPKLKIEKKSSNILMNSNDFSWMISYMYFSLAKRSVVKIFKKLSKSWPLRDCVAQLYYWSRAKKLLSYLFNASFLHQAIWDSYQWNFEIQKGLITINNLTF